MPSKFLVRDFVKGGVYHVFNRGVDRRVIFADEEDYNLFLYYLYIYLTPLEKVLRRYHNLPIRLFNKNLSKEVELLAFCLLPNHFHLLLKQRSSTGTAQLMKQLTNAYTQYFNQRYRRSGSLFEGTYKAVKVDGKDQVTQLSRYIHLDPVMQSVSSAPEYSWSSYNEYTGEAAIKLCDTKTVLSQFPSVYSYKKFIHDQKGYSKQLHDLKPLLIEQD